jgi:hypothetical protein
MFGIWLGADSPHREAAVYKPIRLGYDVDKKGAIHQHDQSDCIFLSTLTSPLKD